MTVPWLRVIFLSGIKKNKNCNKLVICYDIEIYVYWRKYRVRGYRVIMYRVEAFHKVCVEGQ